MAGESQEYVLRVRVKGDEQLSKLVASAGSLGAKVSSSEKQVTRSFSRIGSEVKTLVAGFVGLYAAMAGGRTIMEFQRSMSAVAAVTKASAAEMQRMEGVARQLGATTMFSASQAADAMEFLGRAGFKTDQIIGAMPTTLNLAAAAKLDMATAADITAKSMAGFGLAADEAARVADAFASVAANANTNVAEMGDAMKFAAPAARSLGISLEDTAAAVGTLSNAGISGTMAGTSLRIMFKNLVSPTAQAEKALKRLGLTTAEINPETNSLVEIFQKLKAANLDTAAAFEIFDTRAANGALALVELSDELDRLTDVTNNAQGEAQRMADIMQNNLYGAFKRVQSAAQELLLSMGSEMVGGIQATGDEFAKLLSSLNTIGKAIGGILQTGLAPLAGILKVVAENGSLLAEALKLLLAIKLAQWASAAAAAMITRLTPAMVGTTTAATHLGVALLRVQPLLTALAAGAIWLNQKINDWKDSLDRSIARNVAGAESFRKMIEPVRGLQRALADANAELDINIVKQAAQQLPQMAQNLIKAREEVAKAEADLAAAEAKKQQSGAGLAFGAREGGTILQGKAANDEAAARQKLTRATEQLNQAQAIWESTNAALIASSGRVKIEVEKQTKKTDENAEELDKLQKALQGVLAQYDPLGARLAELKEQQAALNRIIEAGRDTTGSYAIALQGVKDDIKAVTEEAKRMKGVFASGGASGVIDLRTGRDYRAKPDGYKDPEEEALKRKNKLEADAERITNRVQDARLEQLGTVGRLKEEAARMRYEQERFNEAAKEGGALMKEAAKSAGEMADILEKQAADEEFSHMQSALEAMIPLVARFSDGLANALSNVIGIRQAFKDVNQAAKDKDLGGVLLGGLSIGSSVASTAIGLGIGGFTGQRGEGRYGGQLSGDYADTGGALGGLIGAKIGMAAGPAGAGVGALIGGAIGTVVGGFIKQGADEGLAKIRDYGDGLMVNVTKGEGGLGGVIGSLGRGILESVQKSIQGIGGSIASLPEIDLKIRDDVFTVVVGGIRQRFESMDEAMKFGVMEALKQGSFEGLGENVAAALKNSTAQTLEGLLDDVDFASLVDRAGVDELQIALEGLANTLQMWLQRATELGLQGEQVGLLMAEQWQTIYDNLAGVEMTAEERAARNVEIFNAQRALFIAEWTLKKQDIDIQIQALEAQGQISAAQAKIFVGKIDAEHKFLEAEIEALGIRNRITAGTIAQLNVLRQASSAIGTMLANMPPELTQAAALKGLGSINIGGGGGGRGRSGPSKKERWVQALDRLAEAIEDARFGEQTTALTEQERAVEAANAFRSALTGAQGGNLTALEALPEAMKRLLEISKDISGGGGGLGFLGFGDSFRSLFEAVMASTQGVLDAGVPKKITEESVVYDRRLNRTAEQHKQETAAMRTETARDNQQAREEMRETQRVLDRGFSRLAEKLDRPIRLELA